MKIAVIGSTGVVGKVMLYLLESRNFPLTNLIPVASQNSVGKKIIFKNKEYDIVSINDAVEMKPDIALFSAGGSTSLEWAPKFADVGTRVVDNSSAWRMDSTKKLIVYFFFWLKYPTTQPTERIGFISFGFFSSSSIS